MQFNTWLVLFVAAIVFLLFAGGRFRSRSIGDDWKWLPKELRNAELAYAEQVFRSAGDVPIVAKCDRAYRNKKNSIVLIELKTRKVNRYYRSDVIELSAQRLAIQMQTGETVANYGYVLVQRSGGNAKVLHRVDLLTPAEIIALAKRREAILAGFNVARMTCSPRLCTNCAFAAMCKSIDDPPA
jgi:CRISPR-associated exonuclease Cas4